MELDASWFVLIVMVSIIHIISIYKKNWAAICILWIQAISILIIFVIAKLLGFK